MAEIRSDYFNNHEIRFTESEHQDLQALAEMRNRPGKKKGFINPYQDRTYSHLLGLYGEAAVAVWYGWRIDRRFLWNGDGNICDFEADGKTIQVKAVSKSIGDLIFPSADSFKADFAILVEAHPHSRSAKIKGWTDRAMFGLQSEEIVTQFGEAVKMSRFKLRPIQELRFRSFKMPEPVPQYDEFEIEEMYNERAAIIEFDGNIPRQIAEVQARQIINEMKEKMTNGRLRLR